MHFYIYSISYLSVIVNKINVKYNETITLFLKSEEKFVVFGGAILYNVWAKDSKASGGMA